MIKKNIHMEFTPTFKSRLKILLPIVTVSCIIIGTMMFAGILLFFRGRMIMEQQLKDELRNTASVGAMLFDGATLDQLHSGDTMNSSATLRRTVQKLQLLRENVTHVRFAYILRKTSDPNLLEFIADADLALTPELLDRNKNGTVDNEEAAALPGDTYDWIEFPALSIDAFLHPTVDDRIGSDQWGPVISGYAPILRSNGQVAGVLGIDMKADEFLGISNSIFSPVALLLTLLAVLCLGAGSSLLIGHRRLESFRQLDIERSGLLRLAFHQLGGPLTIIRWSLEELEEEGPTSIQRSIINMQEGVKRLTSILKTLKNADLVHTGKIDYKPEFTSLTYILEQVVKEAAPNLAIRRQSVVLDLEKNITMKLDTKLISGVAQELLQNAIDFSADGQSITVRSHRHNKFAEFSVIDHGCGIPKNDLHRMCEEFTRAGNATKFKADGNGLGLYIVRGIVEQSNGRVFITSSEGHGTTVTVRLPIA